MRVYINYISSILRRYKKSFKDYLVIQGLLVLLALITSSIGIYLMNYSGKFKAALIMGFLEIVPIIGNGLYLCYQIIYNLIKQEPVVASNLAILYLTILSVRLILEPILIGRKLNFRVVFLVVLSVIIRIIAGNVGLSVIAIIIFILNTLININEIYVFEQKKKNQGKKRKKIKGKRRKKTYRS